MKTRIAHLIARAERIALANPGREYRKTVIWDDGELITVDRFFYEEACMESEYYGELFAIKEPGRAVYSSLEQD